MTRPTRENLRAAVRAMGVAIEMLRDVIAECDGDEAEKINGVANEVHGRAAELTDLVWASDAAATARFGVLPGAKEWR